MFHCQAGSYGFLDAEHHHKSGVAASKSRQVKDLVFYTFNPTALCKTEKKER
jgi:hypothetical protein